MLYNNIYDALSRNDTCFIYELVKDYRNWYYQDSSIANAMGLCNDGPRYCAYTGDQRVDMSIYELLECLCHSMPITSDQLHTICCTLRDAIGRYNAGGTKAGPLYSSAMYEQAVAVHAVLSSMYAEAHVQWSQMLPLLADALLGHFGADCDDSDTWPAIKEYCKVYVPAASDWSILLAWVMARTNSHELCDEVFSMADNLRDVIDNK